MPFIFAVNEMFKAVNEIYVKKVVNLMHCCGRKILLYDKQKKSFISYKK